MSENGRKKFFAAISQNPLPSPSHAFVCVDKMNVLLW